jgi:signal transduction histidine kinase
MTVTVDPGEPLAVDGDLAGVQQVSSNLVVNALRAMRPGGTVRLGCRTCELTPPIEVGGERGRFACLTVHDEGPGIPPEIRRHLFEPFFSTKGAGEGTGLGLAISWGIARDHGGWIDVKTGPEHGTTFALVLPLVAGDAEPLAPEMPAEPAPT